MTIHHKSEEQILSELYSLIVSANFSREVLELQPGKLSVLRLSDVGWTDLGEPQRVAATLGPHQVQNRPRAVSYSLVAP